MLKFLLERKLASWIENSEGNVFMPKDFQNIADFGAIILYYMFGLFLKHKLAYRIKNSDDNGFASNDFKDIANEVILKKLVKKNKLIEISNGIYARTEKSIIDGEIVPAAALPDLAKEALAKSNIKTFPTRADIAYNSGKSTQVPSGFALGVKEPIDIEFEYGGRRIFFQSVA